MRANEFITEATINLSNFANRNSNYWRNILQMIKNGDQFRLNSGTYVTADPKSYKSLFNIWDGESKTASPEQIMLIKKHGFITDDGDTIKWGKIYKSKEIRAGESDSEQGSKFWNTGNVVEGIMGAAVTAKFLAPDATISTRDIVKVLKISRDESGSSANIARRSYAGRNGNDNIQFTLSLNQNDNNALNLSYEDSETFSSYKGSEEIYKAYDNAAEYVNDAKTVKEALDRVIGDPNPNSVLIESEGAAAENQRGTKADLFITIDGKKERLLSLKAGVVPQVGQMSGAAFETLEAFFKSVLGFGLPAAMNTDNDFPKDSRNVEVKKYILQNGFTKAYKHIYESLRSTLSGDNNYKEYDFTSQVFNGLKHHATLDEDVLIVYVTPSASRAYMEISIGKELREALDHYDLQPQLSGTTLKIIGVPKDELGKQMSEGKTLTLFQLRSSVQGNALRNAVEVGKLVKALADLEKIRARRGEKKEEPKLKTKQAPAQQQQAAQQAPVAAQQAPVAAQQQQAPAQQQQAAQQQAAAPRKKQNVDLSRSPLTAKWMSS
jgi:hypothetical protein